MNAMDSKLNLSLLRDMVTDPSAGFDIARPQKSDASIVSAGPMDNVNDVALEALRTLGNMANQVYTVA